MILTIQGSLMTLIIAASCYLLNTNESPSYFRITLDSCVLLLRYSGFLLRASARAFSIPLIYVILKLYVANISTQRTY